MFGIVDRLLLRTPPYMRDAERVHRVYLTRRDRDGDVTEAGTEFTRYLDFIKFTKTTESVAAFSQGEYAVGVGESARELPVAVVSASFWGFFDATPAAGRFFTTHEDSVPVGLPVTVLSYAFWQTEFGGSLDVIGKALQIGPVQCTIVGVAPPGFTGLADEGTPVAYIPATLYGYAGSSARGRVDYHTTYNWGWLEMLVRRKPGVTVAAASADLTNAYRLSWEAERAISPIVHVDSGRPRATAASVVRERGPNASPVAKVALWIRSEERRVGKEGGVGWGRGSNMTKAGRESSLVRRR